MAVARPGPVRVVVGKGNNGGDGLVVARLLRDEGREVDVLAVADMSELQGDAGENLDRLPGEPPRPFDAAALEGSGAVVDAMLGTGLRGRAARADRVGHRRDQPPGRPGRGLRRARRGSTQAPAASRARRSGPR